MPFACVCISDLSGFYLFQSLSHTQPPVVLRYCCCCCLCVFVFIFACCFLYLLFFVSFECKQLCCSSYFSIYSRFDVFACMWNIFNIWFGIQNSLVCKSFPRSLIVYNLQNFNVFVSLDFVAVRLHMNGIAFIIRRSYLLLLAFLCVLHFVYIKLQKQINLMHATLANQFDNSVSLDHQDIIRCVWLFHLRMKYQRQKADLRMLAHGMPVDIFKFVTNSIVMHFVCSCICIFNWQKK